MSILGLQKYFNRKLEGPPFRRGEEYNYEVVRIGTFLGWPSEWKARPPYLARTGFYWTHEGDGVKCFSCDASLSGCVRGGTVDEAHRRRAPRCRMLAGTDEDNIPLLPPAVNGQEAGKGLPIIPIPTEGILADIIASHNARRKPGNKADSGFLWDANLRHSLDNRETGVTTPYMQPTGQINALTTFLPGGHHTTSLNKADISVPHPFLLKREEERMKTFSSWPARKRVDPVELVKAGFYYFGVSDRVKCAFCHNVLQKWVLGDVPLEEHKKCFPKCPFVQGRSVGNVHAGEQEPQAECGCDDRSPCFLGDAQVEEDPTQPQQSTGSLQEAPEQEDCEEIAPGAGEAPSIQMQEQSPHAASTSGGENTEGIGQVHHANDNPQDDSSSSSDDGALQQQQQQQQQQEQQQQQQQQQQQLGLGPGAILDVSSAEGVAQSSGILWHEIIGIQEESEQG